MIEVVRDDLYPGGTKARYIEKLFAQYDEIVYGSPVCGGAQYALSFVANKLRKKATIVCAKRANRHTRTNQCIDLGANIIEVAPGYLSVVSSRAKAYAEATGAYLVQFGFHSDMAIDTIAEAAREYRTKDPDEVWCAGGSGTLTNGLQKAWPTSSHNVVQVGKTLTNFGKATIYNTPYRFEQECKIAPPFPSDKHYDAKAWEICLIHHAKDKDVLFWNVLGWG